FECAESRGVYLLPQSVATAAFLVHWFHTSSLARQQLCVGDRIACLLWKFREYQVIRIAQHEREFIRRQSVLGLKPDPLRSRQVRRRNDVGRSVSCAKLSGSALNERHTGAGSSGVAANIFPPTLNSKSLPH